MESTMKNLEHTKKVKFIDTNDIKSYYDHEMTWVDATRFENVTPQSAWVSITTLFLERFTELSSISTQPLEIHKSQDDSLLLTKGNVIIARAILWGLFKIQLKLEVLEVRPERYLRLGATVLGQNFGDIDFHIRPEQDGTRMSYRQGLKIHFNLLGWVVRNISFDIGEKAETAEVYNLWLKIIHKIN
ncbi:hypothetical protein [Vallitalea okinawensis]|uniref:hypothetical protein n=1 Tax=Vallitalea okinawensis TaxID=2078660 RepID=UPI000CFD1973|nr:hypothetical protein [Vallitalea okinawensis]